jgi:hypothetical protein
MKQTKQLNNEYKKKLKQQTSKTDQDTKTHIKRSRTQPKNDQET